MDQAALTEFVDGQWDAEIVPRLVDYIRIPNKSPHFDPDWVAHGYMEQAVELMASWARAQLAELPGATLEIVRLPGRTPLIFIEVPATSVAAPAAKTGDCVLLYGHLDKQPEMVGWAEGFGPWEPRIVDGKLYGRGGADDGYAIFAALTALVALRRQGIQHARAVVLIEACEESGSYDLPHYIEHLKDRIGEPSLVVCLDSGCGNYEQLWVTTSLRGVVPGVLTVRVLREGVHSGDASGVVPSSFRISRQLLSRIEDEATGAVRPEQFYAQVPAERIQQARDAAAALGDLVYTKFPFAGGTRPMDSDTVELVLNRTWRPQLAITGMEGLPEPEDAGNVLLPYTRTKISLRLPPGIDGKASAALMQELLEADPPDGAEVSFEAKGGATGWNAPPLAPWLARSLAAASQASFGRPPAYMGEGGTIPFMSMLGDQFPAAQFVVTGVLGPQSNAHGPNEFLHIQTGKRVTAVVARVLEDHRVATRS